MKKVVIVGCGFAGLTAARKLAGCGNIDLTMIDRASAFSFKPMIPDIIGCRVSPEALLYDLAYAADRISAHFIQTEAKAIDWRERRIETDAGPVAYDFALITSGSETAFRGRDDIRAKAFKLDTVADCNAINEAVIEDCFERAVVSGGGYTGIEAATNLRSLENSAGNKLDVIIVEVGRELLAGIPAWMRDYTEQNLVKMRIETALETTVESYEKRTVQLSDGRALKNSLLVWAAGQNAAWPARDDGIRRAANGRLVVNEYLLAAEGCFAAGDAAAFMVDGHPQRLAVQISIDQGACAARNIIAQTSGKSMKPYKPLDLGFVIPMANNLGCGRVLGMNIKGRAPVWMHFLMSAFRSFGWRNRIKVLKAMLRNSFTSS